jgi:adenylate kinase family enzyme
MIVVKPKTKEQLVYFLISNISLGTYDKRFLQNIEDTYVVLNKPMTSNQANLLDKITSRYHRQLAKLEIDSRDLIKLPWTYPPIESLPQYTEVHLDLIDDTLVLRSPYKKEFVTEFKKNEIGSKWDSDSRFWYMTASTHNLKIVNSQIIKHYSKINYSYNLNEFFDSLKQYKNCDYWNPTYKYVNGNFIIVSTNRWLDEAIKDITLDDSLYTLSRLAWHGITIDESVINISKNKYDDRLVDFASNTNPQTELNDNSIIDKLVQTNVDYVLIYYKLSRGNRVHELTNGLKQHEIKYHVYDSNALFPDETDNYKNPVLICDRRVSNLENEKTKKFAKVILTVNSKPINIHNETM